MYQIPNANNCTVHKNNHRLCVLAQNPLSSSFICCTIEADSIVSPLLLLTLLVVPQGAEFDYSGDNLLITIQYRKLCNNYLSI